MLSCSSAAAEAVAWTIPVVAVEVVVVLAVLAVVVDADALIRRT